MVCHVLSLLFLRAEGNMAKRLHLNCSMRETLSRLHDICCILRMILRPPDLMGDSAMTPSASRLLQHRALIHFHQIQEKNQRGRDQGQWRNNSMKVSKKHPVTSVAVEQREQAHLVQ